MKCLGWTRLALTLSLLLNTSGTTSDVPWTILCLLYAGPQLPGWQKTLPKTRADYLTGRPAVFIFSRLIWGKQKNIWPHGGLSGHDMILLNATWFSGGFHIIWVCLRHKNHWQRTSITCFSGKELNCGTNLNSFTGRFSATASSTSELLKHYPGNGRGWPGMKS